jgi:hypothetical protein
MLSQKMSARVDRAVGTTHALHFCDDPIIVLHILNRVMHVEETFFRTLSIRSAPHPIPPLPRHLAD